MTTTTIKPATVDAYIAGHPEEVRKVLEEVRAAIRKAAPEAEETISYGIPAYKLHGDLVFFAAAKKHIGFYATPSGHQAFEEELSGYKRGKGSVQFPLAEPMPLDLITRMVAARVAENKAKAK